MKKNTLLLFVLLISFSSFSQEAFQNWEYWNTWTYTPKAGMIKQFENAAAEKTKKFNSGNDNLIVTYKIVTGLNNGTYLRIQPFQKSKDYDKDKSKELNYWQNNVSEYVAKAEGQQRWARMPWGDVNTDGTPRKYLTQHSYIIKPGKLQDFRRWQERIGEIRSERRPESARVILGIISGGNWQEFVVFNGFDKYERSPKTYDTTWEEEYNKRFGSNSWDSDRENSTESIEMLIGHQVQTLELVESMLPN
ncbi:MAG: hypothetical protein ACKVJR_07685 [Flavobacteriales bacterium]|jgi:hypothetical protein|nr:hypothetical protein [Flavobacteriaceae bacterium]|tara:strand:- start:215 stop:961 length:747 start_codon:yes stop_codon:yes gene_type:complete